MIVPASTWSQRSGERLLLLLILILLAVTACTSQPAIQSPPSPTPTIVTETPVTPTVSPSPTPEVPTATCTALLTIEPADPPGSSEEAFTTPELIDRAFDQGKISEEQRLLLLAYALGDDDRLPPQFRGSEPWRGTSVVLELTDVVTAPDEMCRLERCVQQELRRILNTGVDCSSQ